ncbi:hypothetical protein BKA82DRAFT_1003415 [Pisolithus tinctorius]|uniref:G domain-containing protein n=1 Tax=Pisolithus tinctorius Marx 270 TaxID=870435 RepID=A0A0C3P1B1_PISTI|nr:hypothetical protein BKA82DRAFT_1003415 [Pisolithus tinctorius]KIO01139.1 hypothetical protein M404DRAFT_1003415 [Pisolithus tinctorius Marx 270]
MGLFDKLRWSKKTTDISPTDMVVFIVGPSGSGKSRFLEILLQNPNVHRASKGQKPGSTDVHAERCRLEGMPSDVVLVDTPSFHTYEGPDGEETVRKWMDSSKCTRQCKRAGILYMHNIASNPSDTGLDVSNHLGAFRHTLPRNLTNSTVHVVPTMASGARLPAERIKTAMARLQSQASDEGATMSRIPFSGRPEVAWEVVQELLIECGLVIGRENS